MSDHQAEPQHTQRVLVIDSETEQQALLSMCLPPGFHAVGGTLGDLRLACAADRPGLVVLGPSVVVDGALDDIEALDLAAHGMEAILVADAVSVELLRHALDAGLRDVVTARDAPSELVHSIARLVAHRAASDHRVRPGLGRPGEVLAIAAAKGGSGVTTVAVNVAAELAHRGHRVVLIDADLQFGDVAVALGLRPESNLSDAAAAGVNLTPRLLDTMLAGHDATGLRVLGAPRDPVAADLVSPDDLTRVIDFARFLADVVVVDVPSALTPIALSVLDHADRIGLVTVPAVTVLHDTAVELRLLERLGLAEKTQLVLNRVSPDHHASKRRIEHRFPVPVAGSIPESRDIVMAETRFVPVIVSTGRSKAAAALRSITDHLAPADSHTGALART